MEIKELFYDKKIEFCVVSKSCKYIVIKKLKKLLLFDFQAKTQIGEQACNYSASVRFSDDEKYLICGTYEGILLFFSTEPFERVYRRKIGCIYVPYINDNTLWCESCMDMIGNKEIVKLDINSHKKTSVHTFDNRRYFIDSVRVGNILTTVTIDRRKTETEIYMNYSDMTEKEETYEKCFSCHDWNINFVRYIPQWNILAIDRSLPDRGLMSEIDLCRIDRKNNALEVVCTINPHVGSRRLLSVANGKYLLVQTIAKFELFSVENGGKVFEQTCPFLQRVDVSDDPMYISTNNGWEGGFYRICDE